MGSKTLDGILGVIWFVMGMMIFLFPELVAPNRLPWFCMMVSFAIAGLKFKTSK